MKWSINNIEVVNELSIFLYCFRLLHDAYHRFLNMCFLSIFLYCFWTGCSYSMYTPKALFQFFSIVSIENAVIWRIRCLKTFNFSLLFQTAKMQDNAIRQLFHLSIFLYCFITQTVTQALAVEQTFNFSLLFLEFVLVSAIGAFSPFNFSLLFLRLTSRTSRTRLSDAFQFFSIVSPPSRKNQLIFFLKTFNFSLLFQA